MFERINKIENYESVVTSNYFENWDELEIEGNEGIKDKIKKNIIFAEKKHEELYKQAAIKNGLTVEEFKKQLQVKVEGIVKNSEFFRATKVYVFKRLMGRDKRYKSIFETKTSGGTLDNSLRTKIENELFGFNENGNLNKKYRPIYGYFSDDENGGIQENEELPLFPTSLVFHGGINCKVKKERVFKKCTISFRDSLGTDFPPTPAAKPHFVSFTLSYLRNLDLNNLKSSSRSNWEFPYTEAQYHGQLTVDDIESVHISFSNELNFKEIKKIKKVFHKYKKKYPYSDIKLIEF